MSEDKKVTAMQRKLDAQALMVVEMRKALEVLTDTFNPDTQCLYGFARPQVEAGLKALALIPSEAETRVKEWQEERELLLMIKAKAAEGDTQSECVDAMCSHDEWLSKRGL